MSIIGTFTPTTDGYVGTIRTLTIYAKLRIVAVDAKAREDHPDFKIYLGQNEVGAAWKSKTHDAEPKEFLSAVLNDPALPEPLRGALFEEAGNLRFVWRRRG